MKNKILYIIILFLGTIIFFGSCSNSNATDPEFQNDESIGLVSFTRAPRYSAADLDENSTDIITQSDFSSGSVIYISQLGTVLDPNFNMDATSNLYKYQWYENEEADWDNEYNFKPQGAPIYWNDIKANGQVGNSFSLYGMYYPVGQTIRYDVETDQTNLNNFLISDIMGAYHSSALYTRLRFRFFHLMVYLHVTLYVPVYEIKGDETTGYDADALLTAYVVNPMTNFNINWRALRSSDTEAPLVQNAPSPVRKDIAMYQHPGNDEITEISVRNFYSGSELETDEVRTYEFSVLFPPQSFTGNILCFRLQTPGQQNADGSNENKYVSYYFSSTQLTTDINDFRFTQGTLQHLSLYLPRHANETVLVGANIIDWTDASTGMTVVEQPSAESGS